MKRRLSAFAASVVIAVSSTAAGANFTIEVPGTALAMDAPGSGPPDELGSYSLGLRLPTKGIEAEDCGHVHMVLLSMGAAGRPSDPDHIPDSYKPLIQRQKNYYQYLVRASRSASVVRLLVFGTRENVHARGSSVDFPFCAINLGVPADFR